MKRDCPKRAKDRVNKKNDGEDAKNKSVEMMGGQLHAMFTSSGDEPSETDFSEFGEDDEFTWHQFHIKGWGAQDFEGHAPVVMHNDTGRVVPLTWIFLDCQSTVDLITNPRMLLNIRKVWREDAIRVHCNSGFKVMDRIGDLPGYGTVWYEPIGIANILAMSRATKKFRVIFDSEGGNVFRMILLDREVRFQLSPNGLYYFNAAEREKIVLLLNTVLENREGFTWREYKGAQVARRAMYLLVFPSERDFENMVRSNMIVNSPVTFSDVKNAKLVFGPDITSLKGKSFRRKTDSVVTDYVEIPREILDARTELEVLTDIMFINKLPFLVSISQQLKFSRIEYLSSKNEIALVTSINKIVSYYISHS